MSEYLPSYVVAVPLALLGVVFGTVTVGPLLAPSLVLILFLAASVLAARARPDAPGWKVALLWASVGLVLGIAFDVLLLALVVLGSLIGLWPAVGAGE